MTVCVSPVIRKWAAMLVVSSHLVTVIGAEGLAAAALPAVAEAPLPDWMLIGGPPVPPVQEPPPPAPTVTVNRTVPTVEAPSLMPVFSPVPTTAEITRARVFEEPLLPVGGEPTSSENSALALAITTYLTSGGSDRVAPFTTFLFTFPNTVWRASLMTNLGLVYRRTGHFSRALDVWQQAWSQSKAGTNRASQAVADRAVGELFELNSRLGRFDELDRLFKEIEGRDVRGSASQKVSNARQALWLMRNEPGESFRCGPLALDEILRVGKTDHKTPEPIRLCQSTDKGTSMAAMKELAGQVGLPMDVEFRSPGSAVIVPALVHWKVGHFAALVAHEGDRILMRDPTFGDELWLTRATLDEEASGYFLVRDTPLPDGWRAVSDDEASTVWGKGIVSGIDQDDHDDCPECGGAGMAVVNIHMLQISVNVRDMPIWYTTPKGPSVEFTASYRQREASQPQTFSYANLGPKWTFNWLSYIEDDPTNPAASVSVYQRGSGKDTSTGYNSSTGSYAPTIRKQAVVTRTSPSPVRYERQMPDGSVEVYAQPDGASTFPRKVFLTELRDSQGNMLQFTWDASLRIVAVTDAVGQVTTVSYELPGDPLKITKVTDPFGRTATFAYDGSSRLQSITDLLGMQSQFMYGSSDAIATVTTPYGTTRITWGEDGIKRWAELTDPMGGRERVHYGAAVVYSDPTNTLPQGMLVSNELSHHNTLYWDKVAMAKAPGDPASATDYSWMRKAGNLSVAVPQAIKRPLENRVWYNYQGGGATDEGTMRRASAVGRVLDDGTTQLTTSEFNAIGKPIKEIDPLGRETRYTWGNNNTPDPDPATGTGIDLLKVEQKNGTAYDLIESHTYNSQHLPLTSTDASGQTTTATYNSNGQLLTVTSPPRAGITENRTTTYAYDNYGYLQTVTGPAAGLTTTFTYDGYGRARTTTDADSYTVIYDYDAFDRITKTTYPDGTFEQTVYNRLDAEHQRDRLGHWTQTFFDALRRPIASRDAAGNTTTQHWCNCGSLESILDPNGNTTRWERDLQGRVTREVRADNSATVFVYENTTSRLKQVTDAKGQVGQLQYFADDDLKDVTYTNAVIATPGVSYTYDTAYNRPLTMVDGTGTTTFAYNPISTPPILGAGRLGTIDGPLANDTVAYTYDELGRGLSRSINGVTVSQAYDALGRITGESNALGSFTFTYIGITGRMDTVAYPNGQTMAFSYLDNLGDRRLQQIHNKRSGGANLSKFDYWYDQLGNITSWTQQVDANQSTTYDLEYDRISQLLSGTLKTQGSSPTVLKRYAYGYDNAGNRTGEQIDDGVFAGTYNRLNQLTGIQPGGALRFAGTVSEPASVTVGGKPAQVDTTNAFQGFAVVPSGTSTVTITATDPSGNTRANSYQVSQNGASHTLTYDLNGNLIGDGTRTYEWDAASRLVAINQGTHRTESVYDGMNRRVRIIEKDSGTVTTDRRYVWCNTSICEERDAAGSGVLKRFFTLGVQEGGASYFYAKDHLGSIREVTDSSGALRARYDYDPYGRTTKVAGDKDSFFGFSGLVLHALSGLALAQYRAYDPDTGRWLSPDPAGFDDGLNLYAYVHANPVGFTDPQGLLSNPGGVVGGVIAGAATGAAGIVVSPVVAGIAIVAAIVVAGIIIYENVYDDPPTQTQSNSGSSGSGSGSGTSSSAPTTTTTPSTPSTSSSSRTIPKPKKPSCGCTCNCRADADDTMIGNIKPGLPLFAFGTATASNCTTAMKLAKKIAAKKLGMKPKHTQCLCEGK